ncbi:hypothetical protein D3C84_720660 [compost metagenome]
MHRIENNIATKWEKDTLGIDLKSLWLVTNTNNAYATKLRLAMTSGQELPDVLVVGNEEAQLIQDLIDSGAFRMLAHCSINMRMRSERPQWIWTRTSGTLTSAKATGGRLHTKLSVPDRLLGQL